MLEPRAVTSVTEAPGRGRRAPRTGARVAAVMAAAALVVAGVAWASRPRAHPAHAAPAAGCGRAAAWSGPSSPPACWRPYAPSSPFNQPIPRGARLAPESERVVRRLLSFGPLQHLTAGDAGRADDFGRPAYFAHPGDPAFTV